MEEWNVGILEISAETIQFEWLKTPSNPSFHYPIIPLFQLGLPALVLQGQMQ
jgi:hypothetical protein